MSLTKVSSARDTWDINGCHGIFLQMWTWKITGMLKTVKAGCLIYWAPSVGSPFTSHATDEAGDQTRKWMEMVECHRHISTSGISKTEKHSDWWLQPSWKAIYWLFPVRCAHPGQISCFTTQVWFMLDVSTVIRIGSLTYDSGKPIVAIIPLGQANSKDLTTFAYGSTHCCLRAFGGVLKRGNLQVTIGFQYLSIQKWSTTWMI